MIGNGKVEKTSKRTQKELSNAEQAIEVCKFQSNEVQPMPLSTIQIYLSKSAESTKSGMSPLDFVNSAFSLSSRKEEKSKKHRATSEAIDRGEINCETK
ncbi:unnamed protein product [Wuchereria bancrofti]|uniref:Uncharacterized protein n=1 Tax=Wuchereria bancrofti TaxID=6293 RepID=A0A3P7DXE3_WUCBA|nr:unnamed protein product [Wuchereria bancrofti]